MVQVIGSGRSPKGPSFLQSIAGGVAANIPTALEKFQGMKRQEQAMQQENEAAKRMGIDLSGIQDPKMRQEFISQALQGRQNQQQNAWKSQENKLQFDRESDLKSKQLAGESEIEGRDFNTIKQHFGERFANVWRAAPLGGRTKLLETAIDASKRGFNLGSLLENNEFLEDIYSQGNEDVDQDDNNYEEDLIEDEPIRNESIKTESKKEPSVASAKSIENEFSNYINKQDEGLLPSEKVSRGKERFDAGLKQYQEAGTKLRSISMDKDRLGILDALNKTKKLPSNLGRLNVDDEGNLRAPFLANPETQRYVKTLNEFSSSAKDTFGSRVTNFDLSQYLKRFPTLMNDDRGRKQLLDQMKIVNDINAVYYKNLKNVYDKAGGVRNIDADVAERFAEKFSEGKINALRTKFNEIGQFSTKPEASEFKGKRIKDKETGEIFISDGKEWVPEVK